jgi:tyrosine-protein kinase Etk/Wzc
MVLISVEVDDKDPKFAADLANAHVEELRNLLGRLAVTEAQQRRMFFEKQLQITKENLGQSRCGFEVFWHQQQCSKVEPVFCS